MINFIDLTGQRFGRLVVIERIKNDEKGYVQWLCQCDCGNKIKVFSNNLRKGNTKSCGCLRKDKAKEIFTKHKKCNSRLYVVWRDMKRRCTNPHSKDFINYGARGIKVCKDWENFKIFEEWAIKNGYDEKAQKGKCTLDRINNNGNYQPNNCRWVTAKEQANNRKSNHYITINNKTHTIAQWAEIYQIKPYIITNRIRRNWNEIDAVITPLKK